MPYKCVKCGYETEEFEGKECPDCGGLLKETDSEVNWLTGKEKKDLNNPDKDSKEDDSDDVAL
jgi:predicted ATP-dependent serine protease